MIYWFYRLIAFGVRCLPLQGAYWLGLRTCDLMFFLNKRGRQAVRENLRIVMEGQGILPSRHILHGCARKTFQYFGKYLADFIRFRKLSAEGVRERVSIQGLEHLEAIRDSRRGAIMLTAHYGNWELGGAFIASMGIPINAVVRPVDSPSLERIFQFFREQRGMKVIPLDKAGTGILKTLKRGEVVALVGDRDFTGNGRAWRFFGRETSLPRGAAWFAHRLGVPVYIGFATRAPDDTFILRHCARSLPVVYFRSVLAGGDGAGGRTAARHRRAAAGGGGEGQKNPGSRSRRGESRAGLVAGRALLRLVDPDRTIHDFRVVELLNRGVGFIGTGHFNETEAARTPGIPILDHPCRSHFAVRLERRAEVFIRGPKREISNIYFHVTITPCNHGPRKTTSPRKSATHGHAEGLVRTIGERPPPPQAQFWKIRAGPRRRDCAFPLGVPAPSCGHD